MILPRVSITNDGRLDVSATDPVAVADIKILTTTTPAARKIRFVLFLEVKTIRNASKSGTSPAYQY